VAVVASVVGIIAVIGGIILLGSISARRRMGSGPRVEGGADPPITGVGSSDE
jgi:hypothetical protein